jgi:hypothetical protein
MKISMNNDMLLQLQNRLAKFGTDSMPITAAAMEKAAESIQGIWQEYAVGKRILPGIEPLKPANGGYAQSIHVVPSRISLCRFGGGRRLKKEKQESVSRM